MDSLKNKNNNTAFDLSIHPSIHLEQDTPALPQRNLMEIRSESKTNDLKLRLLFCCPENKFLAKHLPEMISRSYAVEIIASRPWRIVFPLGILGLQPKQWIQPSSIVPSRLSSWKASLISSSCIKIPPLSFRFCEVESDQHKCQHSFPETL